ncbi:peptidase S8 and S53 subtilisin kexin sedolisin [Kribbella flavida DSM 17836]|uniref:alpha-amylase n=1 Tax=Kribbella flavida (strain DSM 17836 / JCM 10339 / NBRC 14399) TaxID=479435 RepID=D2Q213_KRIFD|nr:peptidase S8 and S53 subtilisin kexin sedolisin [Kribbella flavida DSM 17836]
MSHTRRKGLARSLVSALAAAAVVATGLAGAGTAQAAPTAPAADPASKIKPDLLSKLEGKDAKEATDYWVRFSAKADLSKAGTITDWNQRGTAVAAALRKTAAESQAGVKAELDAQKVKYQAFWGTNAIRVSSGSLALAQSLATHAEVEGLYTPTVLEVPKVTQGKDERQINALEWGLANINADDVWSQYGDKGAGIVIANIDTGVQYDHPALVKQYRGNLGNGQFDHNYNWFDAAGTSPAAPADGNGHGTHTMGTMVGDDGAGNQIGVAPAVKWIAANGCCPSDAALITSGQWMLEPTNLAGQNPDASKRPNIINNSWGSTLPSNDPFMEDITLAWTASGIFGAFSNGNSGSACQTSGSPGSLQSNYSAGAYDINNTIASFSGRGVGQNGEIKPNLAAPGVNVRSSIPGSGYASFNGTSMASPHLAGTIALLWSAAPALKGDVPATRALLDNAAVDKADSQCGGTTDDNNVYGEGRLDALALLNAAPIGDTGTLTGKVSSATGVLAGASVKVTAAGQPERTLTTGADGRYSSVLPAGDYTLTAASFGYKSQTTTATVTLNTTTTKDFVLESAPSVTIGGSVTDGSGHGWPLYAKVSVEGPGGVFDYTNPTNGRYSFTVPSGTAYTLKVEAQYPGYQTVTQAVTVGAGNLTKNIEVPVRSDACATAPGYRNGSDGVYETFDTTAAPNGWTVVDNKGNGQVWKFEDLGKRGNLTGGGGGFAIVDSDEYGSGQQQDTSLVSPVVDLTDVAAPVIRFNQDFNRLGGEKADVDLSIDGGSTWTNVLSQTTADVRGVKEIAIPQAAGQSAVQVRFHYYDASYEWWWQVDSVLIGTQITCEPVGGGIVVGNVKDANTNGFVNGAVVTRDDEPTQSAVTVATPEDTGLADGFYWLYSSESGVHGFTAKAGGYVSGTQNVDVEADWVTAANFSLAAGRLSVTPTTIEGTLKMPTGKITKSFTVKNTGGAPVELKFGERDGGFEIANAGGGTTTKTQVLTGAGAPLQRLEVPTSFASKLSAKVAGAPAVPKPLAAPWADIADYPATVMDNRVVHLDGKIYSIAGGNGSAASAAAHVYDPASLAWTAIAPLPGARNAITVGAVGGKIIASSGWGSAGPDAATWSYDPAANAWSPVANNPAPRAAAGQAVLDGKLYAVGGCTTASCTPMSNTVVAYDAAANTWQTLANYPKSVAFASCGAIDGKVYCSGGNDGTAAQKAGYVYDPATNAWSAIADSPADHWAASFAVAGGKLLVVGGVQTGAVTNAGFAFDPAAGTWAALPNANNPRYRGAAACGFYKVGGSSGGFTATADSEVLPGLEDCAESSADVSWLSIDKTEATLAPGASTTVKVTLTASVDQPGKYSGSVTIAENTPYSVEPVAVTMNVTPPTTWSKLLGTVTGVATSGATAPLPGAIVQVDSWASSYTFTTDAQGKYAYWLDRRNNPLTLIAAKDGYRPQTRTTRLVAGQPAVEDFALKSIR